MISPLLALFPQLYFNENRFDYKDENMCIQILPTWIGNLSMAVYLSADIGFLLLFLAQMSQSSNILRNLRNDLESMNRTSRLSDLHGSSVQVQSAVNKAVIRNTVVAFVSALPTLLYYGVVNNIT